MSGKTMELEESKEHVMKRVELNRITELFWKSTADDEKTPFAHGTVAEHGSISKIVDDKEKPKKEVEDEKKSDELEGPMSNSRKFFFVMSFNAWILYFALLLYLIPCRQPFCDLPFDDVWETNLTYVWPLTNVETFNEKGLPSLAMLGYADGQILILTALAATNGFSEWNNSLSFIPRKIQCHFETTFDANSDGIADCLLTGFNDVYAFNASNGHVFWEHNLPSDVGNIVSRFHPTINRNNVSYLIGTCGDKLVVLNTHTGRKVSEHHLPCSAPFDIRIVSNVINKNFSLWSIVCDYGDKIEAWAFTEDDVLKGGNSNTADASGFALLFSRSNSGGSIDLGCDVIPYPGGPLLLSWSDRVVMVTSKGTVWEKTFPDSISVASIKIGRFTEGKQLQIAAAVNNGTNSIIYILESENGTTINSVALDDRLPQSLEKINGDMDTLLLKSLSLNYSSVPVYNFSDPIPREKTNFALIEFKDNKFVVMDIVTAAIILESAVNVQTDGEADLLLIKNENGLIIFQKYVIYRNNADQLSCGISGGHMTHFASEM